MNVSLTATETFRSCEQKYDYAYVRKLRPLVTDVAPHRGILIHEYLATYYAALKGGVTPDEAHGAGLMTLDNHETELQLAASLYFQAGRMADSEAYANMLASVTDLARRYHNIHGRADAERYEVILVEEDINMPVVAGIVSRGRLDLVLRDRITGLTWLVEHKSTVNVPDVGVRLWNLQTILYAAKLERTRGITVDGILWNYVRTKPPTVPALLKGKRPALTRRADLDTTWEVYEEEIRQQGLNPREYADVRERLIDRENTVYFPRFEHVIIADADLLLHDYAITATRIRRSRWEWENNRSRPVRTLGQHCSYCRYTRLCESVLVGGDEEDLIKRLFKVEEGRAPEPAPELEAIA